MMGPEMANDYPEVDVFRIEISWIYFLIAGLIAVIIAMGTMSYHAIKAALINPAKNLRSE